MTLKIDGCGDVTAENRIADLLRAFHEALPEYGVRQIVHRCAFRNRSRKCMSKLYSRWDSNPHAPAFEAGGFS